MEKRPYQIQLDRIKRWNEKIKDTHMEKLNSEDSDDLFILFDMIYAFFIFCHHVKDYIINDSAILINKKIVENFINSNDCLKVCADICNGVKHLEIGNIRSGSIPVGKIKVTVDKNQMYHVYLNFDTSYGVKNFFNLADDCIEKWEEFIQEVII